MKVGNVMKLKISNIAKIEKAVLDIDGITVIAGENNTGKSTIGKVLFAIFNSMNNMEEKIKQEKRNRIHRIINTLLQSEINYPEQRRNYSIIAKIITDRMLKYMNEDAIDLEAFLTEYLHDADIFKDKLELEEFVKECINKLEPIINISDKKAMSEVITRWFNRVFEDQISPLMDEDIESQVELIIKNKKISYLFKENVCKDWNSEIDILHTAFYIDNPFVIDKMSERLGNQKITESHLLNYLCKEKDNIFDGIFDAIMAKDKLDEIYNMLYDVVDGDIVENSNGEYCLRLNDYVKPLLVKNLSTGLKSFTLIKMLLEKGGIKEKDVLILDEPEIHLHPEWKWRYAQLIVIF